jgi:formamidopyrimidine-DNA glycosylase
MTELFYTVFTVKIGNSSIIIRIENVYRDALLSISRNFKYDIVLSIFYGTIGNIREVLTMIELPESYVLAEQINQTLKGKVIMNAEANHTPHAFAWYTGNPAEYHSRLAGKTIASADVYSGNVRIRAEDMVLVISTPIWYHIQNEKLPQKHQLLIEFEDFTVLTCTIQMWGCMFCFKDGDANGMPEQHVVRDYPSPYENRFDESYFESLLARERLASLSAKAFLTTEQRIPGLGNGALQDILWTAKIHPKQKMSTLSKAELNGMYKAVKNVLAEMRLQGGRDTERDLFGCPGGYKTVLSKNTAGKPCPVCSSLIKKEAYLGGSIYYCPGCQK